MKIAIIAVAYNRVLSLDRLLKSLNNAYYPESTFLIISIDKSDTDVVEKYADEFVWKHGEKRVVKHEKNLGLRNHMFSLGRYFEEFDSLIVLEDDVTVAQSFYYYSKQCVEKYSDNDKIAGISLYNFPINYQNGLPFTPVKSDSDIFLMQCAQSWGEVWMKKSWQTFYDWYQLNNDEFFDLPYLPKTICNWPKSSWLKYHTRYCIEKEKFFVYPYVSLSTNNADPGTHNKDNDSRFQTELQYGFKNKYLLMPEVKYDGFFENLALKSIEKDVCVDLYGEKGNRMGNKYWLTTVNAKLPIVKSFALHYRPWDANVLYKVYGNGIFLYESKSIKTKYKVQRGLIYSYLYRLNLSFRGLVKLLIIRILEMW